MALKVEHEIHERRRGRNHGVALILVSFVALILALTVVKVTGGDFELPSYQQSGSAGQ
ncbi:MAG: cytochrome C oxidase assembly protein [Pseudomonadota bacterium]